MNPNPAGRHVLVVDDERANRNLLTLMLRADGHVPHTVEDGEAALAAIAAHPPDLVLLDINMPGVDGYTVCRKLKANPATRLIPVVLLTGLHDRERRIQGINAGADDFIGKPFDSDELRARVRSLLRLKKYTDALESAEAVFIGLAQTIEARDPYTVGHCQRLAFYATRLGARLRLAPDQLDALDRGGHLHDIGKIGIPDAVLKKPGELTPDEYELMKQHTVIGDRLIAGFQSFALVRPIVRHHHERRDGSGYPDGLKGDNVPLLAEIMAIVDLYDALTTDRPYRRAQPAIRVHQELQDEVSRGRLKKELVEAFTALLDGGELGPPPAPE